MKSLEIAFHSASAAEEKQASDIVILDMREVSSLADYFMICAGANDKQTRAIAEEIKHNLKEKGIQCSHMEGAVEGKWIVMDFFDVLVHIFSHEAREFYQLERLWGDAQKILAPEENREKHEPKD